jgi:hypothetical protein
MGLQLHIEASTSLYRKALGPVGMHQLGLKFYLSGVLGPNSWQEGPSSASTLSRLDFRLNSLERPQ